jgi:hypothetical protein
MAWYFGLIVVAWERIRTEHLLVHILFNALSMQLTLCNEFAVDLRRILQLLQHHHALAHFLSADTLQGERSRLTGETSIHLDTLALNGLDSGSGELAKRVRSHNDGIADMDDTRLDNARDYCTSVGHREDVVDDELEGPLRVILTAVRQDIEESSD